MHKVSVTYILISICLITTVCSIFFPNLYIFGLNSYFIKNGNYGFYVFQLFFSEFLHGGLLHFLMNSMFLYYFGYSLEMLIGRKKYIYFFLFITFFNGILLTLLDGSSTTIGISGFCMAILAYYTLELKSRNNPEYKGGLTAIALNIAVGFMPGISLWGHLFGALGGFIFYFLNKDFFRPKLVGRDLKEKRA